MEARKFSWVPALAKVLEKVASVMPEKAGEFALAISNYGCYGIEPTFEDIALELAFEGIRDHIDNSINARSNNSGGRPKNKTADKTPVSNVETPVLTTETPVSNVETPVTVSAPTIPNHTNTNQTNTDHTNPVKKKRALARFTPPTAQEVEEYARGQDLAIDAQAFIDFYASKGWKIGTASMKDWQASVRNWVRRDFNGKAGGKPASESIGDEYAKL